MRKFLLTSAALGMLVTGAEAAPFAGGSSRRRQRADQRR